MNDIKQVIVVLKSLNMRKGKIAAQVAHASMKIFFDKMYPVYDPNSGGIHHTSLSSCWIDMGRIVSWTFPNAEYFEQWIQGSFKKICVYVECQDDLLTIEKQAQEAGIHCAKIIDAGLTEFRGVHTVTCVALGPWESEQLDAITGHLKLL